jgi:hypothetical protein
VSDTLKTVLLVLFFAVWGAVCWVAAVLDARAHTHKWVRMYPFQKDPRRGRNP